MLVSPQGVRTYRATFYYPGSAKPHAVKLGRVGEMALDEAREKTREIRGLARKGLDPRAGDPGASSDFKAAVKVWTKKEQIGRKRAKSADQTEVFMLAATTAWHSRPVAAIRKGEIEDLLHVKREVAPYAANRLHAHLATFFRWCVRTDRIQINPMQEMPRPWEGAKARNYEWFAGEKADAVIAGLWKFATELGGDEERFLKLLLITGKRKQAVATMMWEQIGNEWFWTPPPGSKSKRCHAIPLPKLAVKVLGKRMKSGRVLQRVQQGRLVKQVRQKLQVENFILHGIRHVVETKLGELKVPFHIRDLLLDHAPVRGAGRGYDHHSYRDEMLGALELWCAHILKVTKARR